MTDQERIEAAKRRWFRASHSMQAGVAACLEIPELSKQGEPKHLRVGVNNAMVDNAALVKLLVDKGLITDVEYFEAIADAMEREKASYEERLSKHLGHPVTLGTLYEE